MAHNVKLKENGGQMHKGERENWQGRKCKTEVRNKSFKVQTQLFFPSHSHNHNVNEEVVLVAKPMKLIGTIFLPKNEWHWQSKQA